MQPSLRWAWDALRMHLNGTVAGLWLVGVGAFLAALPRIISPPRPQLGLEWESLAAGVDRVRYAIETVGLLLTAAGSVVLAAAELGPWWFVVGVVVIAVIAVWLIAARKLRQLWVTAGCICARLRGGCRSCQRIRAARDRAGECALVGVPAQRPCADAALATAELRWGPNETHIGEVRAPRGFGTPRTGLASGGGQYSPGNCTGRSGPSSAVFQHQGRRRLRHRDRARWTKRARQPKRRSTEFSDLSPRTPEVAQRTEGPRRRHPPRSARTAARRRRHRMGSSRPRSGLRYAAAYAGGSTSPRPEPPSGSAPSMSIGTLVWSPMHSCRWTAPNDERDGAGHRRGAASEAAFASNATAGPSSQLAVARWRKALRALVTTFQRIAELLMNSAEFLLDTRSERRGLE
jgi:hypothetical protein